MENLRLFRITGEDGFFLTFIAAWLGIRASAWEVASASWGSQIGFVLLVLDVLLYAIIISQIRYHVNRKPGESPKLGVLFVIGLVCFVACTLLIALEHPIKLQRIDALVFPVLAVFWFVFPYVERFGNKSALGYVDMENAPASGR